MPVQDQLEAVGRIADPHDRVAELRVLVGQHPGDAAVALALAEALTAIGKHDEAVRQATRATELDPDSIQAMAVRGLCLVRAGDASEGVASIRAAARRDALMMGYLFDAYATLGRPREALHAAEELASALNVDLGDPLTLRPEMKDLAAGYSTLRMDVILEDYWQQADDNLWLPTTREAVDRMAAEIERGRSMPQTPLLTEHLDKNETALQEATKRVWVGRTWIGVIGLLVGGAACLPMFEKGMSGETVGPAVVGFIYAASAIGYFFVARAPRWQVNADVLAGSTNPVDWMLDKLNRVQNTELGQSTGGTILFMIINWWIVGALVAILPVTTLYVWNKYRAPSAKSTIAPA